MNYNEGPGCADMECERKEEIVADSAEQLHRKHTVSCELL